MRTQNNFFKLLIITNMNTLRNKVSLIGRLGAQPEVTTFETGRTLARFTLATNESYKDKNGEWHENTQWHTINAWGRIAERVKKALNKGQEVIVEGKLVHQSYENKNGEKRYGTIIEATEFLLLTPKTETASK
jgi:single-strand DNA-binding protein